MSTAEPESREAIQERLLREMRLMSSFDALLSQAIAERVGMHATDIETMDLLNTLGPLTAGDLSQHTGLTSGATTRLIDRLERAGYVRRRADGSDRRRVIIEPVWENLEELGALFAPLLRDMAGLLQGYDAAQLATILDFVSRSNQIVTQNNARVRSGDPD